jgi:hypothetical protein
VVAPPFMEPAPEHQTIRLLVPEAYADAQAQALAQDIESRLLEQSQKVRKPYASFVASSDDGWIISRQRLVVIATPGAPPSVNSTLECVRKRKFGPVSIFNAPSWTMSCPLVVFLRNGAKRLASREQSYRPSDGSNATEIAVLVRDGMSPFLS